jgi:hypothetical protein
MRTCASLPLAMAAAFGIWMNAAAVSQALGGTEVATACPALSPGDGRTGLIYAEVVHSPEGISGHPDSDVEERRGTRTYALWNYERGGYRRASIECAYGAQSNPARDRFRFQVPGLLLKCELIYDEPARRPYPPIFQRFWCTSRIEGAPRR